MYRGESMEGTENGMPLCRIPFMGSELPLGIFRIKHLHDPVPVVLGKDTCRHNGGG